MSVVLVLIGLSMMVAGGFLAAFLWAVRKGQFDDHDTPPLRILFDEPSATGGTSSTNDLPTPL